MVAQEHGDPDQYLTFFVTGEEVAIHILQIKEVIAYRPATRIPAAPAFLRGVLNLRGAVVPVVDLALRMGLPEAPITKNSCIVVVEVFIGGRERELTWVGVLTEGVGQVIDLSPGDIERPPTLGMRVELNAVVGLGRLEQRFVPILDLEALLARSFDLGVVLGDTEPGEPIRALPAPAGGTADPRPG